MARADGPDWIVTVTASNVVRELTLLADRVSASAVADRALETVLSGESVEFRVSGAEGVDPARFSDPAVLRSANDLVVKRAT